MARFKDKEKALKLRLEGKSYSQIKKIIGVSKSTLSYWLKNYPLSDKRIRELRDWNEKRIENYRETRRKNKEKLLKRIYDEEKIKILPIFKKDLFIAGLFLYWGEGAKTKEAEISLSNTNPATIKFFIYWLEKALKINRNKIKIKLHLYGDMNIGKEIDFWKKILGVKKFQFAKPYVKNSNRSSITYKNGFNHGTCNIIVRNAILTKKILMGLRVIQDYFNLKYK